MTDADSEVTLYPTIHILPKDTQWKSKELSRRLADAEEVWFELMPGSETDPALQQSMMSIGMAPGSSLSASLSSEEVEKLKSAIKPLGVPFVAADQMRPWLAMTLVTVGVLTRNGFDPESGVEKQLAAMTAGKKIRALETPVGQMEMLASIPKEAQLEMLRDALNDIDETVETLNELVADWALGDVDDLEGELIDEMKDEMPEAYGIVFTARNKKWADQIELEMKGAGTDFIAVGAGHLVGSDGVPEILEARGYTVKRLQ